MTAALIVAALLAAGYVASGVRIYRADREADRNAEMMTPWLAFVNVAPGRFISVVPFRGPIEVEFPRQLDGLFGWERRLVEWAERRGWLH